MSILVTGGAGFIGSSIVKVLNEHEISDIIIVDDVCESDKWKNLVGKKYLEYINKNQLFDVLPMIENITHIIHMGACSDTTQKDFDYLWKNNVEFSQRLYEYCVEKYLSFIYASSAATYGKGDYGFSDKINCEKLIPLNRYAYSKHFFDLWVKRQIKKPKQCVGLKFFNVYGPNEYHKNKMSSMILQGYQQINEYGAVTLFKTMNDDILDGEQKRDFIYVKDICKLILWLLKHDNVSGLYNVGSGKARTYNDMVKLIFKILNKKEVIKYVDMPTEIKKHFQSFTEADIKSLREIGYDERFYTLEEGLNDYINNYLIDTKYY